MYWWHVCSESLQQKPSYRHQQPFKVMVAYVFKKAASIRCVTTIHQSHYMTYMRKSTISTNPVLPDPENFGWRKTDDEYEPFMKDFLLLSRWLNLLCVHVRKQTEILYVGIARRKGWCVPICAIFELFKYWLW